MCRLSKYLPSVGLAVFAALASFPVAAYGPKVKAVVVGYSINIVPGAYGLQFKTPLEAFVFYQKYLADKCAVEVDCTQVTNLRPNLDYGLVNDERIVFIWDSNYYANQSNGILTASQTSGSITAEHRCPNTKPRMESGPKNPNDLSQSPSGTYAQSIVYCIDLYERSRNEPKPQQNPDVSCGKVGNPILVGSGVKLEEQMDYAGSAADGLMMTRYYSSDRRGWVHSYESLGVNLINQSGAGGGTGACYPDMTFEENPRQACFEYFSTSTGTVDFAVLRPNGFYANFVGTISALQKPLYYNDQLYPISVSGPNNIPIGWYLYRSTDNALEEYDTFKRLLKITTPSGRITRLSYSDGAALVTPAGAPVCSVSSVNVPVGKLACVTGPNGRQLNFTYNTDSKLASLVDPEGGVTSYEYDGPSATVIPPTNSGPILGGGTTGGTGGGSGGGLTVSLLAPYRAGMITKVIYPDGSSKTYFYNEQAYTANTNQPYALTGIVDEGGTRFATYRYDVDGNAVSTEHAGGVEKYSTVGYDVTDPLGAIRTYAFENKSGRTRFTGTSQPGGAGCVGATSSSSSDDNLNVVYRTDFNGSVTTYAYDLTRNLEILRTEALGTPNERKTSTAWHPDVRVPSKIAQGKRLSFYVYNGQPDPDNGNATLSCVPTATAQLPTAKPVAVLCKVVETATSDETGALGFAALPIGPKRVSTFTYDAAGNVLTTASNRAAGNANTTLAYYSASDTAAVPLYRKGDLQRISNALGHTTLFQEYDPNGRIKKMTDPNGLVTAMEYSARGWLTKVTTSGGAQPQVLSMEYFPTGKLKKATQPDGAWVQFEYDPAQRLVGMVDNVNNSVRYSLDGMGNRITEENRDSTSTLSKMVVRVFDALGRVQQVQGAAQ